MDENSVDDGLQKKFQSLVEENRKNLEEFNNQRAKMKELFLIKDAECQSLRKELDDAKSEIYLTEYKIKSETQDTERKAQEEIASWQQLVHETIEESASSKNEYQRLFEEMKIENHGLKDLLNQHQDSPSLAPVLSHVKKTIARKLGGDSGNHEVLEDSMRKAQEDAEVLRSLVVPLEEEIKALKEKLRTADEELQKFHEIKIIKNNSEIVENTEEPTCKSCSSYINKLSQAQKILLEEQQKLILAEKSIEHNREELHKEGALRRDLESQWQEKRELHKEEVQKLTLQLKIGEKEFSEISRKFIETKKEINEELLKLIEEREQVHRYLETLQRDNDILSGKHIEHSQTLQNQEINLPNNVEELQELLLKTHENLIEAKIGCEHSEQQLVISNDEKQLLKDDFYLKMSQYNKKINSLEEALKKYQIEFNNHAGLKEKYEKNEIEFKKTSSDLRVQVIELREANDKLDKSNYDLKSKMTTLQQGILDSEAVQKDFVRLSQSLQMELEKIRAAECGQVRWMDEEDVDNCATCKKEFTVTKRKLWCRHCGTIYCSDCLKKTVPSGQRSKPARVCDVCHTLLVRNTAPYFSEAPPPHSP